ncbi:hypothetical protein QQS21_010846 [Conoideocrella luteorostrata]|uniref:Uncharacterized protein n=1 Tax=Conoideocrella luteorostrata TaxID=1105319 RepID=A0AAJ0CE83_9HYPO|nr:hypothetical protein QQS21_010846 [Conoideocrella luteorostrata]
MPPSSAASQPLEPEELAQAVAKLAQCLKQSRAQYSISGGAASMVVCMQHGLEDVRSTEDIDLVVQPAGDITAESISTWLLQNYPNDFVAKITYGVSIPSLAFRRSNGSITYIEIEMFESMFGLKDLNNEVVMIDVSGVQVPVFSARWLLREKIITAFERRGSKKERTDVEDACNLLEAVKSDSVDLTNREDAVRHLLAKRPDIRQSLEVKVICPAVLGRPWAWNEYAEIYWRFEKDELRCVDENIQPHKCEWNEAARVWYFTAGGRSWFYSAECNDLRLST